MSMKNSIGNQTRDLPARSAVPEPTAPPRADSNYLVLSKFSGDISIFGQFFVSTFIFN
jgi:hypothetical protein